jgi:hypothetical protein
VSETLTAALIDLLAPEIERMVDERVAQRLAERAEADRPDEWMTTAEAAAYRRLTPAALRARVRRGTVTAYDDNGRWLFRRSQLDAELAGTMTPDRHQNGASAATTAPPPTPKECTFDA